MYCNTLARGPNKRRGAIHAMNFAARRALININALREQGGDSRHVPAPRCDQHSVRLEVVVSC